MVPVDEKKGVIQSIVSLYETGRPEGDPTAFGILPDGAGFSYGIHQATDKSGSLLAIVDAFLARVSEGEARDTISMHRQRLVKRETTTLSQPRSAWPSWADDLANALVEVGSTEEMKAAQIETFDVRYWAPTRALFDELKLEKPLSMLLMYDISIQSGIGRIRQLRNAFPELPPSKGGVEVDWTRQLAKARVQWISNYRHASSTTQALVRRSVYRSLSILELCTNQRWDLKPPFSVLGPGSFRFSIS